MRSVAGNVHRNKNDSTMPAHPPARNARQGSRRAKANPGATSPKPDFARKSNAKSPGSQPRSQRNGPTSPGSQSRPQRNGPVSPGSQQRPQRNGPTSPGTPRVATKQNSPLKKPNANRPNLNNQNTGGRRQSGPPKKQHNASRPNPNNQNAGGTNPRRQNGPPKKQNSANRPSSNQRPGTIRRNTSDEKGKNANRPGAPQGGNKQGRPNLGGKSVNRPSRPVSAGGRQNSGGKTPRANDKGMRKAVSAGNSLKQRPVKPREKRANSTRCGDSKGVVLYE